MIPDVSKEHTAFIFKGQGVLESFYDWTLEDIGGYVPSEHQESITQLLSITTPKTWTLNINTVETSYLAFLISTNLHTSAIPTSMKHIQEYDTPAY